MSKILITGITGQMGSTLAEELVSQGHQVYGLCRRSSTTNTSNIDHIMSKLHVYYGDLSDRSFIIDVVATVKPDLVFHTGAQSHVGYSFQNPQQTIDVNLGGTLNLLEAVRLFSKGTRLIHFSTSELYGGVGGGPYNELSPFYPRSPYGVSKLAAHSLIVNYREAYNLWCCNAICFNYEGPKRGLEFVTRKVTNTVAKIKLGIEHELVMGNMNAYRDWSHCKDVMNGVLLQSQQDKPEEFVFASGRTTSIQQMVEQVFSIAQLDWTQYLRQDECFMRPSEVPVLIGDSKKARTILKWQPTVSLNEMLNEMYEHDLALEKKRYNL